MSYGHPVNIDMASLTALLNVTNAELAATLLSHKKICPERPRGGAGFDAFAAPSKALRQ